jgi:hypothetical protein
LPTLRHLGRSASARDNPTSLRESHRLTLWAAPFAASNRTRFPWAAEVGHDQHREATESDERSQLGLSNDIHGKRQHGSHNDSNTHRRPQSGVAGVIRQPYGEPG